MSYVATNCIPCDAKGNEVDLNTEYMYAEDGLKLEVIRFEFYTHGTSNWYVLTQEYKFKADKYKDRTRYAVSELYLDCPVNTAICSVVADLESLRDKLNQLMFSLTFNQNLYDIFYSYAHNTLNIESDVCVGASEKRELIFILSNYKSDLLSAIKKLENQDA